MQARNTAKKVKTRHETAIAKFKKSRRVAGVMVVCSMLAGICFLDFLTNFIWTTVSISVAVYNPYSGYIAVIIILALNCVAISFAACFISMQQHTAKSSETCLRFYRFHRLILAALSVVIGTPLVIYATWYIVKHWESIESRKISGAEILRDPYVGFCIIIGGIMLIQGIIYFSVHKCFSQALRLRASTILHENTSGQQTAVRDMITLESADRSPRIVHV